MVEIIQPQMNICRIQKRLAGGDWTTFRDADTSPVVDDEPSAGGNPEKREYRGIYLQKNQIFGQYSPTVAVVTTP